MNIQTSDVLKAAYTLYRLHSKAIIPLDDLRYFFGKTGAVMPNVAMSIVELEDDESLEISPEGVSLTFQGVCTAEDIIYAEPEDDTPERDQVEVVTAMWTLHSISSFDEPVTRADIVKQSRLPQAQAVGILSDLVYDKLASSEGGNKYALTSHGKAWVESKSATLFAKSKGIK